MSESAPGGEADVGSAADDKVFSCPTCGDEFDTKNGKSIHHYQVHGTSIAKTTKECAWCGDVFEYYKHNSQKKYCSDDCRAKSVSEQMSGDKNWNWVDRTSIKCDECGNQFKVKSTKLEQRRFCCRSCRYDHLRSNWEGEDHPRWVENTIVFECEYCGEEYEKHESVEGRTRFCSIECFGKAQSENRRGENSPQWKGGYEPYYGPNWNKQRQKALQRDQHRCQICRMKSYEMDLGPEVHHIQPLREFKNKYDDPDWWQRANRLSNLITLCRSCHREWEGIPLRPDPS